MTISEARIESDLIAKLRELKYEYREDIKTRFDIERNFRTKFDALNRVTLSDTEFARLLEKIVTPDVFAAAKSLNRWSRVSAQHRCQAHQLTAGNHQGRFCR